MTQEEILINQEMDTPQVNPLKAEENIPEKSQAMPKSGFFTGKLKTPKQKIFFGLLAFWIFLLIFAAVISLVNQARKGLVNAPVITEISKPTPAPILNDNQIPQAWQEKFQPIEDSLKPETEIYPPTFDLRIGE